MPDYPNADIEKVRDQLREGMIGYMRGDGDFTWDAGYTQAHVDRCMAIVDDYLARLQSGSPLSEAQIRDAVKTAVLALNDLNDTCDGGLIETGQREELCEILLVAATKAGLGTSDDITEEWREW